MASTSDRSSEPSIEPRPTPAGAVPAEARDGSHIPQAERTAHPDHQAADPATSPPSATPPAGPPSRRWRRWLLIHGIIAGLAVTGYLLVPVVETMLNTISTDDAYVNGHVTFVAPRVAGQVSQVLVDDNYRVKKGDLLVQLDKEPYQVQLAIKQAAVVSAEADLVAAQAQVRGLRGPRRSPVGTNFFMPWRRSTTRSPICEPTWRHSTAKRRPWNWLQANLRRGEELLPSGGISKEDLDNRRQTVKVDEAAVDQALQTVYADRAGLGLPAQPPEGHDLSEVPADLAENFSSVRQALGQLLQSAAQIGYAPPAWDLTYQQVKEAFRKLVPEGDLEHVYAKLIPQRTAIKQAEAKLLEARRDLAQAELNLRYCDIVSEIDGVVTRRNVNPGNDVQVGESLMAIRSLTEIWIDANFKETQLGDLRIGQRVRCEVDMYGSRGEFEGRITGFTMGTGQTLALLPPQNATGNYREDRPAAAGPRRANRLRSGQGPIVRRFVGRPLRVLQGTAHGTARRRGLATASPTSARPHRSQRQGSLATVGPPPQRPAAL